MKFWGNHIYGLTNGTFNFTYKGSQLKRSVHELLTLLKAFDLEETAGLALYNSTIGSLNLLAPLIMRFLKENTSNRELKE